MVSALASYAGGPGFDPRRVVSALASCAGGPGFDPRRRRGKFVGPNTLPFVSLPYSAPSFGSEC